MKWELHRPALLQSHRVETRAQGIATTVLTSALLAAERTTVVGGRVAAVRMSFSRLLLVE